MFKNVNTILASVIAATGMTVLAQLLDSKISMRPIIGGFIVGTGLLIFAFFNVQIAVALALLILLTSLMNNAVPILTKVMGMAS